MTLPKTLVEGYRRFVRDRHAPERGRYIQLAGFGQAPTAMVIACCDARIDVSAIFDVEAGRAVHPAQRRQSRAEL
jgi:carbonic anhydrase